MAEHYLVTGCAGFIGSKVADLLLTQGHRVMGIDNLNDAYDVRLKMWRLENLRDHGEFSFGEVDIGDKASLDRLFSEEFAAVVNLAARAGVRPSVKDPASYYETNLIGVLNLLEQCRTKGVPKFVQASTSSLYGDSKRQPFQEDADTSRPLSPYAASKKAAETLCYTYHHLYDIDITVLRYFTVYGPAGRPDLSIFRFAQWIAEERPVLVNGDGSQSRDFTYVDDIARGTAAALRPLGYEVINLGSDSPVVLLDVIGHIENMVEKKAQIQFGPVHPTDVPATWADIRKADQLLKWKPESTIEDGLRSVVGWYFENRNWAKDVNTLDD